jgi:hypothetical protein
LTSKLPLTASKPAPSDNLTAVQFQQLAEVPAAIAWFANIDNARTRRAYESDLREFMAFTGIEHPTLFRSVSRGHVLAWRRDLERRDLSGATIRRKLAALSSLFDYLCESNAVTGNPVEGVKRQGWKAAKARRLQLATIRPARFCKPLMRPPCAVDVIARFSPPCCTTACAARSCVRCA